ASQGAGRLFWPLTAGFLRMLVAIAGGWLALRLTGSLNWLFAALALGLVLHGVTLVVAISTGAWFRDPPIRLTSPTARSSARRCDVSHLRQAYLQLMATRSAERRASRAARLIHAASRDHRRLTRQRPAREYASAAPCYDALRGRGRDIRGAGHHQSLRPLHPWRHEPARVSRPAGRTCGLDARPRGALAAVAE